LLTEKEIREYIEYGHERKDLDFKKSCPCNSVSLAKDIMAMANTRYGGTIIIGIDEEENDKFIFKGMSDGDLDTYKEDELRDQIGEFADPAANFFIEKHIIDGKKLVIIKVSEFDLIPVICRRDGKDIRRGAIYTRTENKRWASEEPKTSEEMRGIIELASDKMMVNLEKRGYTYRPLMNEKPKIPDGSLDDNNRFKRQRGE